VLAALAATTVPWVWAAGADVSIVASVSNVWAATWPPLVAMAAVGLARAWRRPGPRLPEGDIVVLFERVAARFRMKAAPPTPGPARTATLRPVLGRSVAGIEGLMRELPIVGLLMLLVGVVVWFVLWLG
jgi:hypothetical protein